MEFSSLLEDFLVKFGDLMDRKFAEHLAGVMEDVSNDEGGSNNIQHKFTGLGAVILPDNGEAEQDIEERTCDELCCETVAIETEKMKEVITTQRWTGKELCTATKIWKQSVPCSYRPHKSYQKSACKFKARMWIRAAALIAIEGKGRATRKGQINHRRRKKRGRWKQNCTKSNKHTSGVCQPL